MKAESRKRDAPLSGRVVGLSISEGEDLLSFGFGSLHLRELLMRLGQPILRAGADLAYGGHFKPDSFTRVLLELVSEEERTGQEDGTESTSRVGILYNHSAWPNYADISEEDEAEFVDVCRFVPITQELAGISSADASTLEDLEQDGEQEKRVVFNKSVALSAMRRFMAKGMTESGAGGKEHAIPAVSCRIFVSGKYRGFTGVLPGLYEELLYCFLHKRPVYLMGGYGGATRLITEYLQGRTRKSDALLTLTALRNASPWIKKIESTYSPFECPDGFQPPKAALEALRTHIDMVKEDLPSGLDNGLDADENKRLFEVTDPAHAASLIMRGLTRRFLESADS